MQYFSLQCAVTKIGRGGFPQVQSYTFEEGRKSSDSDNFSRVPYDSLPNFKPYIATQNLQKGSAVTDLISHVFGKGFICSEKARKIIVEHSIGETNFYDVRIKHKETYYDNYKMMHSVNNYTDKIDFGKSIFHIQKSENNVLIGAPHPIANLEEYKALSEDFRQSKSIVAFKDWRWLTPIEIHFKDNYQPEHDIFIILGLNINTYISERLRSALERSKITGMMFDFDNKHIDFR